MNFKGKLFGYRMGGLVSSILLFVIAFAVLVFDSRLSRTLTRASYNSSFDLCRFTRPDLSASDVVIIYIDEDSLKELNKSLLVPMKRSFHAALLERLKRDGAKAVVMDIVFSDAGNENDDIRFTDAIRSNGRVVLGVDYNPEEENAGQQAVGLATLKPLTFPYAPFANAAAANGLVVLHPDDDFLVRQHFHQLAELPGAPPSLSWAAARMLHLRNVRDPGGQLEQRWVYYYGPSGAIPHVSYKQAYYPDGVRPGFFHNKIVFIGARPITSNLTEKRDELRSPYSAGDARFPFMPVVEIHATQFLNLLRGDWLKRPSPGVEIGIVALGALLFGFGLLRFRPWAATGMAVAGGAAVLLTAQSLFAFKHIWFAWLIIVAVQIPCALLFSIVFRSLEWIVQRRKLEEERRRADLRIREQAALLDKAQDAIIVHDLEWRAQYWNKSAENLYGWGFEEVKQMNLRTDLFKTDDAKMLEALQNALAKGEWLGELKQTAKGGKRLIVQSRWTLVRDNEGRPKSVFVINTDVTEQKNLEAQFLRTQRMESIGTLAGGIAHDLNNVLSPILMGVELMKVKIKDEHSQQLLTTMASSARRGSDMVKQVLTFARGHVGERSVLQISYLIREMQKIVKETFPKAIDFNAEIEDLWPILGDATQIHQIILNLCVNASDAMPDGGSIIVRAKNITLSQAEADKFAGAKPINYVLLSTTDTGTGIPPAIIDKIFEPFFTTKEIGKGTGLGLSTVISIVKSHGGFLDLQTEVGKGTTFNVYLPAADSTVAPVSAVTFDPDLFGKGETVLVVDDEPAVLELTKNILVHYGYKVVTAIHGADAVALYSQYKEKIKVIVMDIMMPVMDGTAAIRALKAQQPALQFIAISGLMQGDKLKELFGGEAVTFLAKPYPAEKLLRHLRRLILKPPG